MANEALTPNTLTPNTLMAGKSSWFAGLAVERRRRQQPPAAGTYSSRQHHRAIADGQGRFRPGDGGRRRAPWLADQNPARGTRPERLATSGRTGGDSRVSRVAVRMGCLLPASRPRRVPRLQRDQRRWPDAGWRTSAVQDGNIPIAKTQGNRPARRRNAAGVSSVMRRKARAKYWTVRKPACWAICLIGRLVSTSSVLARSIRTRSIS